MRRLSLRTALGIVLALLMISACSTADHQTPKPVVADGNTVHYEMRGNGNQTLVLIHGWSNSLHVWDEQIESLSKTSRVVAVDLPGFGASKNNRNSWTMASFGSDVAAVLNHLDLQDVIMVGFSMGGPVSIETARHAPGRIKGIVLVDIIQNPEATYPDDVVASMTTTYMDAVTHPTLEKVKPFFRTRQEELGGRYIDMVKDVPKTGWEASLSQCLTWLNTSCTASIKSLDIPILAINADQHPTKTEIFRKYNPHFKARIIKGVNHVVLWESPEEFTRYLKESIEEIQQLSNPS